MGGIFIGLFFVYTDDFYRAMGTGDSAQFLTWNRTGSFYRKVEQKRNKNRTKLADFSLKVRSELTILSAVIFENLVKLRRQKKGSN